MLPSGSVAPLRQYNCIILRDWKKAIRRYKYTSVYIKCKYLNERWKRIILRTSRVASKIGKLLEINGKGNSFDFGFSPFRRLYRKGYDRENPYKDDNGNKLSRSMEAMRLLHSFGGLDFAHGSEDF